MREMLDRLLRDATLVTLALALALGWTLVLAAQGAAETISELLTHHPNPTWSMFKAPDRLLGASMAGISRSTRLCRASSRSRSS
jgi:hypothetical protein